MLHNKTIAVVVPAYNEETQISMVIESMLGFVVRIVDIFVETGDGTLNNRVKAIRKNKHTTQTVMAKHYHVSKETTKHNIKKLQTANRINCIGSNKKGYGEVTNE